MSLLAGDAYGTLGLCLRRAWSPIVLADEGPKVEAIKNNTSLSDLQKAQQIRAIHQQTDPQMNAILSPAQYEKLKAIRQQAIQEAIQKRRGR